MTQSGSVEDWKEILSEVTNDLSSLSLKLLEYFIYYMNFCKAFFKKKSFYKSNNSGKIVNLRNVKYSTIKFTMQEYIKS